MSGRFPALPAQLREQVIVLAETGLPQSAICRATGLSSSTVGRWISRARDQGRLVPPRKDRWGVTVMIDQPKAMRRLADEAEKRGMTTAQLVDVLLSTIIRDNLFNAVLEDAF